MSDTKSYYRQITEVDIGLVARELLGDRITQESDRLLQCDCPHHQSQSKRSLHIALDKQGWYCFACGVGGGVLQLVEFIQSGAVTRGQSGVMPESHRQARDFLAARVGLPPLSQWGLSPEEIADAEATLSFHLRVQEALTELARFYHRRLLANPEALEWLQSRYCISREMIDQLLIGFAGNGAWEEDGQSRPGVLSHLTGEVGFTLRELAATGAFHPTAQDSLVPFYEGRIVFPYWKGGRVVFLIGRQTPWTPAQPWEQGKYKKLPVHDEHGRRHIAPCIDNSVLYNEDCLLRPPQRLTITEGVTDCISLMQAGFPTISPVTVNIRQADWDRLVPRLAGVKTVYICQDNELSQAGIKGALRTAQMLSAEGIDTRLVALPLEEKHRHACQQLAERFEVKAAIGPRELAKRLEGRPAQEIAEAERLLAEAKINVNEYFAAGHSAEDFEALLAAAQTPLEFAIARLSPDVPVEQRNRLLEPILEDVAALSPLDQTRYLKLLQERFGKDALPLTALRQQVKEVQRQRTRDEREQRRQEKRRPTAPDGTCQACVEKVLIETGLATGSPDYAQAAEEAFVWFGEHGGRFFRTLEGEPFCFFEQTIYWMDSSDRGRRRLYHALVYKHTGLVHTTNGGRTFYEVLANLAVERGEIRDHFGWLHTDVDGHTVYLNLNNPEHQIARILPAGVEILTNGGNDAGVILDGSPKMKPIRYLPEADLAEADRLFRELIIDNLTCPLGDRYLVLSWTSCFLLMDFAGTRPMTRFEGPTGSGKTTASKLISTVLYGQQEQKTSTDAANYVDGSRNPLILLDNIETKQMTDELAKFMLTSITGIAKEKRKAGTDSETVIESTKCLLNTSGIEPLGGDLSEVLSRCFTIRFDLEAEGRDYFLEAKVLAQIPKHRDLLLSALMKRTSQVLAMIRDGAQERVMRLLHAALGNHPKRRCNDYLSLMYLMMLAGSDEETVAAGLETLHTRFLQQIGSLNVTTQETARESNPIATALNSLFRAYQQALESDRHSMAQYPSKSNKDTFLERYQIEFAEERLIQGARARDLFVALRRVSKEFNLPFTMTSVQQFAQRFSNDLAAVQDAGFEIAIHEQRSRIRTYDIQQAGTASEADGESGEVKGG